MDPWEFALNITYLIAAGHGGDLIRHLIAAGLIEHADERRGTSAGSRVFQSSANSTFSARTCFILTPAGEQFLKKWNSQQVADGVGQPVTQTNPVTGYQTTLYRSGATADFLGWIYLANGNQAAGYIYIRRPVSPPYLGSTRYVVMDIPPELMDPLLRILQSGEPLQVRFFQGAANADAAAFLEHRP